ncbi:MAG: thioredoxin-disulfide reductase [Firmicutes bacterium]|nr:thioredoxin-disulfide reductase [Bacillota bacterium]
MEKLYDVVIIGSGPAGLSAGLYAGRALLSTLIIEKEKAGGQIMQTAEIENYPGGMEGESGPTLVQRMAAQADHFGVERVKDVVTAVELSGAEKIITCQKETYRAKTVIVATGASPAKLGCPGEEEYTGRGVSYCATCDAPFYGGLEVFVAGGGDAAVEEAIYLSRFARKVTIIHRRDQLRAAKSIQEKAFKNEKIDFLWNSTIEEIKGEGLINEIVVKNLKTGELTSMKPDPNDGLFGLFVFVGYKPQTELFTDQLDNERGYLVTDENMHTNIPGVFAAGDIRKKVLRQVVTAAADGAIAAVEANKYLEEME